MTNLLDSITSGNVSMDWPMIVVGRRGFGRRILSTEQVMALALEQIGRGTPEQDELAALLVNTDPSEWQTVDRYLELLAETEQFDRSLALRKWRLAELRTLVDEVLPVDETVDDEEPYTIFYAFVDFWQGYAKLPDSLAMVPDWGTPVKELFCNSRLGQRKRKRLWGAIRKRSN